MRLADDETVLTVLDEEIILRPTLRAAMRLEKRHGFEGLLRGLANGHLTIIGDIIHEGAVNSCALTDVLRRHRVFPLRNVVSEIQPTLMAFVLALAGHDEATASGDKRSGNTPQSFAEYHERLFQIATGHLGWTPATAWASTPAEILAARHGRNELISDILISVFGGKREEEASAAPNLNTELDRDGLDRLRGRGRLR